MFANIILLVISAALGGFVTYILTNNSTFNKAASEFRNTFTDFIQELRLKIVEKESNITMSEDIKWSKTTMDKLAPDYEKACIEFEPFVAKNIRGSFVAAYILFLAPNRGDEHKSDERHDYHSDSKPSKEFKIRKLIYERLNEVLKFAEPK